MLKHKVPIVNSKVAKIFWNVAPLLPYLDGFDGNFVIHNFIKHQIIWKFCFLGIRIPQEYFWKNTGSNFINIFF